MNIQVEENLCAIYNSNTIPQALPTGATFSLNST